jgi:hypothetical protein
VSKVYICLAKPKDHQKNLNIAARQGGTFDWWEINKSATRGDLVIFYLSNPISAFYAIGTVESEVRTHGIQDKNYDKSKDGRLVADIRDVKILPVALSLVEARDLFPKWAWLKFARNHIEVPKLILEELLKALNVDEYYHVLRPKDIASGVEYHEGSPIEVRTTQYERDTRERERCISHYGHKCFVCGFDFGVKYGAKLAGYIHVHHMVPLSRKKSNYIVDPIRDLRPVCPNCHAAIHSKNPPYSVDEVIKWLR